MSTLFAASAFLLVIAIAMLVGCTRQIRRGRLVRATGNLTGGVATASLGAIGLTLGVSYLGYDRLTAESIVGQLEFVAIGEDEYSVRFMRDGKTDRLFELNGDEWQIDARMISWTPPATILGLEPVFELDRISGRYADIERERRDVRSVYSLSDSKGLNLWALAKEYPAFLPGVDAYYGTATYVPMADGARYEVSLSRDALIARPVNEQAQRAVGQWRSKTGKN
jgi:hypothetical protein